MNKSILTSFLALLTTLLLVSCGASTPSPLRDYSDAVTNINQVDPRYRPYFRSQNGSNFSLADQRKAYFAALETARTPVRRMDASRAVPRNTRYASRGSKARGGKRVATTRKAKRGSKARRGGKASSRKRVATTRKATRKSSRRRRG